MTSAIAPAANPAELLDALADAEWELHEAGSRLDVPGDVRFRLLQAAHRAHEMLAVADPGGETVAALAAA